MRHLVALLLALLSLVAQATEWRDHPGLAALFRQAGVTGSFVLYDPQTDRYTGHDRSRAETRYSPASTFKIANSLIGLHTGAVASVDEPLPYHGPHPAFLPAWERDMSLREAIALSNVPIYQELARRIGPDRMRAHLAALDYGNADTGTAVNVNHSPSPPLPQAGEGRGEGKRAGACRAFRQVSSAAVNGHGGLTFHTPGRQSAMSVDRFWLDGPLAISAVEQTRFLARLARAQLPLPTSVQAAVADITRLESRDGRTLHGKTGWQNAPGAGIGWWVGWVEDNGQVYAFALNLDIHTPEDAKKRVELGQAALRVVLD